jgi:hypothetical protein
MKKFLMTAVASLLAGGALCAGEVEFKLEKAADWQKNGAVKWVGKDKDVMEVTGPAAVISSKMFDIDPKKTYKLEAEVKMLSGEAAPTYIGFKLFNKQGKEIFAHFVNARPGSETTVVKAVKAGDKVMIVKANPLWKSGFYAVALNAKKDLSDLPNFDCLIPSKVTAKGQEIEVQLKTPATKAIPAGTVVRAHTGGGYMYTAGGKTLEPNGKEIEFKGIAKGVTKYNMGPSIFAPGTAKAQVIMLVNWKWNYKQKSVTQIKDVELEIK